MKKILHLRFHSSKWNAAACSIASLGWAIAEAESEVTCKRCLDIIRKRNGLPKQHMKGRPKHINHVPVGQYFEQLLNRAHEHYKTLKQLKYPYRAPETLPQRIESDQVRSVLFILAEELYRCLKVPQ